MLEGESEAVEPAHDVRNGCGGGHRDLVHIVGGRRGKGIIGSTGKRSSRPMHYISANGRSPAATFREAVLAGQPDDRGLYFPSETPRLDDVIGELQRIENEEIAFRTIRPYVGGEI